MNETFFLLYIIKNELQESLNHRFISSFYSKILFEVNEAERDRSRA